MQKYIGEECPICHQKFTESDDVVVCPECATPYHRECYMEKGECVNSHLHNTDFVWTPSSDKKSQTENKKDSSQEGKRCLNCGEINDINNLNCTKCGAPLTDLNAGFGAFDNEQKESRFPKIDFESVLGMNPQKITADTTIDNIKISDYNKYIKTNNMYFLAQFIRFSKVKTKLSMNFTAFIAPYLYLFYRKMYKWGIITLLIEFFVNIPTFYVQAKQGLFKGTPFADIFSFNINDKTLGVLSTVCTIASYALRFGIGLFANYLYFCKAKKDINRINTENVDDTIKAEKISSQGGGSFLSLYLGIAVVFLLVGLITFIIKLL